jgi:hypothetical protein
VANSKNDGINFGGLAELAFYNGLGCLSFQMTPNILRIGGEPIHRTGRMFDDGAVAANDPELYPVVTFQEMSQAMAASVLGKPAPWWAGRPIFNSKKLAYEQRAKDEGRDNPQS